MSRCHQRAVPWAAVLALVLAAAPTGVAHGSTSLRAAGPTPSTVGPAAACITTVSYGAPTYSAPSTRTTGSLALTTRSQGVVAARTSRPAGSSWWTASVTARASAAARALWHIEVAVTTRVVATSTTTCGTEVSTRTAVGVATGHGTRGPTQLRYASAQRSSVVRSAVRTRALDVATARALAAATAAARDSARRSALALSLTPWVAAATADARSDGARLARGQALARVRLWAPVRGTTWQWQLSGTIDTSVPAAVYDVDLFDVPTATVTALHAAGRRVICYLSAGSWEPGRPDSASFPSSVIGAAVPGWDERWLDIRALSVLRPIMSARLDLCRAKGFDGVEADLVDAYAATSGFPLTAAHQLAYNRMLADLAHARGLAIGLKNDLDQVAALQPYFDFAVNEQCAEYGECSMLAPFLAANKAVFHAEYRLTTAQFCPTSAALGLSSIRKTLALTAWRQTC